MLTRVWLFPGQGSQYTQMGRHIWPYKLAADVLSMAEFISGLPLRQVIENGPEATLRSPEYLEPSVTALQAAYVLLLKSHGIQPETVAGYSLGEIGALYCAGCISLVDALTLASARGKILTRTLKQRTWASRAITFSNQYPASALNGIDGLFIAAHNSPREFTITGEVIHMPEIERFLLRSGAAISPVEVDGPWHSELAAESARQAAPLVLSLELAKPLIPLCLGTSGQFETQTKAIRDCLIRQIETPVYWADSLEALWRAGVRSTLEIGPGRVLTSFVRSNWAGRLYDSRFLDRPSGRAISFDEIRLAYQEENRWTRSA